MIFDSNKPIYLQIADHIFEKILKNEWQSAERILSVREFGVELGVNPNTVMRAYEYLSSKEIIYNKRGIGYFISDNAKEIILQIQRKTFFEETLPAIINQMNLLNISKQDFDELYVKLRRK